MIAVLAAVVAIIVLLAILGSYTTFDMNQLYQVTYDGVDQDGTTMVRNNEKEIDRIFSEV